MILGLKLLIFRHFKGLKILEFNTVRIKKNRLVKIFKIDYNDNENNKR